MRRSLGLCAAFALAAAEPARANTDEIQVYDGSIAPVGAFNLTLHNNFAISGAKSPDYPGGLISNHALNGVPELAYGVTDWFEAGLYLPLYSIAPHRGPTLNGVKLRALFALPHAAEREFFYGVNFEFSENAKHWDAHRFTSEIRGIFGWHLGKVDVIVNPILDSSYEGISKLDLAPSTRLAYNFSKTWTVAAEEYADFGPIRRFLPGSEQSHQLFAVADYNGPVQVEAGIGFGLTRATDRVTIKLIVSREFD